MARTKTTELMDMVFDKLMNNTNYEQFEPEMAEEAEWLAIHPSVSGVSVTTLKALVIILY